jgi:hypothetical protein
MGSDPSSWNPKLPMTMLKMQMMQMMQPLRQWAAEWRGLRGFWQLAAWV